MPDDPKQPEGLAKIKVGRDTIEITPEQRKHVQSLLAWMTKILGIDPKKSLAENDWMLIVKLHAMIETGLNAALVRQFDAPELAGVIAKLDTSNTATGKVGFAKALQILHRTSAVFVQKLSELRNFCVHDVRNFDFDIEKHLEALTADKRSELVKPVMKIVKSEFRNTTSFREALYVGTMAIMMELQLHDLQCENRDLQTKIHRLAYEAHEAQKESKTKEDANIHPQTPTPLESPQPSDDL